MRAYVSVADIDGEYHALTPLDEVVRDLVKRVTYLEERLQSTLETNNLWDGS